MPKNPKAKAVKAEALADVTPPPVRDWTNAGEDYVPGDIGIPGLETADNELLKQVITDAQQAVTDKKNAKAIIETVVNSIKMGVNLFRAVRP